MLLIMISSGPLAGGHLQSKREEMQGKMGIWVPFAIVRVLVVEKPMKRNDHEQVHEHDYERDRTAGCAFAVAHYNRSALRP
jgi:hypothetical protein